MIQRFPIKNLGFFFCGTLFKVNIFIQSILSNQVCSAKKKTQIKVFRKMIAGFFLRNTYFPESKLSGFFFAEHPLSLAKRNFSSCSDELIKIDEDNRKAIAEAQTLQEERNAKSKLIGEYASSGKSEEANAISKYCFFIESIRERLTSTSFTVSSLLFIKLI